MTLLGHLVLLVWILLGVVLFSRYPGHRLIIGMFVLGVLFLPEFEAADFVEGVPQPLGFAGVKLVKPNAIALGLLIGSLLFDRARWRAARPRWFDLPMFLWCIGPIVSSVANSLVYDDPVAKYVPESRGVFTPLITWLVTSDLYDGVVRAIAVVLAWGVPYCLGRLYITDATKLGELVYAMVAGALVYMPLCLLEMVASPQLHRWVYGFHQHIFTQTIRYDGYRPMVFLEHGIAVGFWMAMCALAAVWLWRQGSLQTISLFRFPVRGVYLVGALAFTALACKSTGALMLGILGFGILWLTWRLRRPIPVLILLCVFPLYATARTVGAWDVSNVLGVVDGTVGGDRAQSLEFRLDNEGLLVAKALRRPLVGWGGWGRSRVYDMNGEAISIADGLWILTLGERGLFGLVTLGFVLLLPLARFLARHGSRPWTDSRLAPVAVAAVILGLYSVDCLMNAMLNPVFILLAAGLIALPASDSAPSNEASDSRTWRIKPTRPRSRIQQC